MTAHRWLLIPGFSIFLFTACPGPQKPAVEPEQERAAIMQHSVIGGMTPESVTASMGKPSNVTTSKVGRIVTEQWSYPSGASVTFTDGIVSSFLLKPAPATPKRGDWMFDRYKNPLDKKPPRPTMH